MKLAGYRPTTKFSIWTFVTNNRRPPLPCAARRESIRAESSYAVKVLFPLTLSSGMERRVSAYRPHSLSSAHHTSNSYSFPRRAGASQFRILLFFLSAQAHTDSFSLLRKLTRRRRLGLSVLRNSLTYAPAKAKVDVGLDPECTRPDWYQRQDTVLLQTSSFP
jgi:hypothetical protein